MILDVFACLQQIKVVSNNFLIKSSKTKFDNNNYTHNYFPWNATKTHQYNNILIEYNSNDKL